MITKPFMRITIPETRPSTVPLFVLGYYRMLKFSTGLTKPTVYTTPFWPEPQHNETRSSFIFCMANCRGIAIDFGDVLKVFELISELWALRSRVRARLCQNQSQRTGALGLKLLVNHLHLKWVVSHMRRNTGHLLLVF
jgi:hypothetical protein